MRGTEIPPTSHSNRAPNGHRSGRAAGRCDPSWKSGTARKTPAAHRLPQPRDMSVRTPQLLDPRRVGTTPFFASGGRTFEQASSKRRPFVGQAPARLAFSGDGDDALMVTASATTRRSGAGGSCRGSGLAG